MKRPAFFYYMLAIVGFAIVFSSGCATGPYSYHERSYDPYASPYYAGDRYGRHEALRPQTVHYGRIADLRYVSLERDSGPGVGAVVGALIGGVAGSNIGSGRGRTAATVGGAIAGGAIGDHTQRRNTRDNALEITVHLDNGDTVAVVQGYDRYLRVGQRVRIVGHGRTARVVFDSY